MRKNSQLHFLISTSIYEALQKEADEKGITLSELCRNKLTESSQLIQIKILLEKLNKKISGGTKNGKNKSNR